MIYLLILCFVLAVLLLAALSTSRNFKVAYDREVKRSAELEAIIKSDASGRVGRDKHGRFTDVTP